MIETASQPIPAKPALALVTRSRLLLAATPSTLLLLLCFTLAAELSALEMFLVNDDHPVEVAIIDDLFDPPGLGVRGLLKHSGGDSLLILVNEDDHRHLGVDVTGLTPLNGRTLHQLYGDKQAVVRRGGIVTRMQPHEVKLFCTSPRFKTKQTKGRNYTCLLYTSPSPRD